MIRTLVPQYHVTVITCVGNPIINEFLISDNSFRQNTRMSLRFQYFTYIRRYGNFDEEKRSKHYYTFSSTHLHMNLWKCIGYLKNGGRKFSSFQLFSSQLFIKSWKFKPEIRAYINQPQKHQRKHKIVFFFILTMISKCIRIYKRL